MAIIEFHDAGQTLSSRPRQFICNVWSIDGSDIGDAVYLDTPISAGGSRAVAATKLELPVGGTYLVEVLHPAGKRTQRTLYVEDEGVVRFELPKQRQAPKFSSAESNLIKRSSSRVVASSAAVNSRAAQVEVVAIALPVHAPCSLAHPRDFLAGILALRHKGRVVGRWDVASLDQTNGLELQDLADALPNARVWLLARVRGEATTLLACPTASTNRAGHPLPFELAAFQSSGAAWRISLNLLDPLQASLLEFLANGDWASAWATFCTPNAEVQENGFSRAIGAYARALAQEEDVELDALDFLNEIFDARENSWLPDLRIALAWALVRHAQAGSERLMVGRRYALEAVEHGFPFFSVGLRVLSDTLNFLAIADPQDERVRQALGAVTRVSLASDRNEIITTIDIPRLLKLSQKERVVDEDAHA